MRKRILTLSLALAAFGANAQTDSLSMEKRTRELQEVVVKSDVARTSAEKSVFLPTKRQRNAATDAVALLQHMMIPQLQIDPMSLSVKTIANEEVAIFIDFLPATKEDLQGMNTQDVKCVEIYDFPKDVRFQNKPHVVNFVMQKYELGGYTKLTTTNLFISEKDLQTNNSLYSKLAWKRWTFDINLSDSYADFNHVGSETKEVFRLPEQEIARMSLSENGEFRTCRPSASLRAIYNTEKIQLSNRLEFLYESTPRDRSFGGVSYSPSLFSASLSESSRSKKSVSPKYEGDWSFTLPHEWRLSVRPSLGFSHNTVSRFYREGDFPPIVNDIKEDVSYYNWAVGVSKTFSKKHSIRISNFGQGYQSQMDYAGSTTSHGEMRMFATGQGVGYNFTTPKLNLSAHLTYGYTYNKMNDQVQKRWFPISQFNGAYSPNSKHSFTASFGMGLQGAGGSDLNSNVLQTNELMYYRGNPLLEDYHIFVNLLQYSWMPSSKFTASAFAQNVFYKNFYSDTYQLFNDGQAIIRNVENIGDLSVTTFGANMTLRLLEGKLQFSASPRCAVYNLDREDDMSRTCLNLTSWAVWYVKQFYVQVYFASPARSYEQRDNTWTKERSQFQLTAGWGNAKWKASVILTNPFRTDWRYNTSEISSPLYSINATKYNVSNHQRIDLKLSYTFNYGKKVKQGNELGTASGGRSSIL